MNGTIKKNFTIKKEAIPMIFRNKFYRYYFSLTSILTLNFLAISTPVTADIYPGDTTYSAIVQTIYHQISSDNVQLAYDQSISDRTDLCAKLISKHNTATPGVASQTNASFINETITLNTCLNALWYSSGYSSISDLATWAGTLSGTWYDDSGATFNDPAVWNNPINVTTSDPLNDLDSNGNPRIYIFQQVIFSSRTGDARYGWNQSHSDVAYIWGWDAKDNLQQFGEVGTHVGWTFDQGQAKCIIWVTRKEAFLECVKTINGTKRRTSAGLFGIGQWSIAPLTPILPPREAPRLKEYQ